MSTDTVAGRKLPMSTDILEMMKALEGDVKIRTACLQKDINTKHNLEKRQDLEDECLALSNLIGRNTLKELKLIVEKCLMMLDKEKEVTLRGSHRERDSGIGSLIDDRPSEQSEAAGIQESCVPSTIENISPEPSSVLSSDQSSQIQSSENSSGINMVDNEAESENRISRATEDLLICQGKVSEDRRKIKE